MGRFKTHEERDRKKHHRREAMKAKAKEAQVTAEQLRQSLEAKKTRAKRPAIVQFRLPNKVG